jgi:glutamine synthetase
MLRARSAEGNVFLENRLPGGAVNPYLAIAATVAAGMHGLERQLECPQPMDSQVKPVHWIDSQVEFVH